MKLLNPGYGNNIDNSCHWNSQKEQYDCEAIRVNNSLWWNSGSGTCYDGTDNATTTCDFTNSGLSDEAKEYIVDQTLYLGGIDNLYSSATPDMLYGIERGNNVIQNPSDGITRTTRWVGKVGLIYPSDIAYASNLNDCSDVVNGNCSNVNWMMNGTSYTITPYNGDNNIMISLDKNLSGRFLVDNYGYTSSGALWKH